MAQINFCSQNLVKQLLSVLHSDQIAAKDTSGKTALMHSLCAGQNKTFTLLSNHYDINPAKDIHALLKKVIQASNEELVSFCNSAPAFYEDGYEDFHTAWKLFSKEEKNRIALVQSLLKKAHPETEWHASCLKELGKKAGLSDDDVQIKEGDDTVKKALFTALKTNNSSLFKMLLSRLNPKYLKAQDDEGTSLLSMAIKSLNDTGDEHQAHKTVNIVLDNIAAHAPEVLCLQDKWGVTPLHYAAWWRHYDIAKSLIERLTPEKISLQDDKGTTPLMASVSYYSALYLADIDPRITAMILNAGLSLEQIQLVDNSGKSALTWIYDGDAESEKAKSLIQGQIHGLSSSLS